MIVLSLLASIAAIPAPKITYRELKSACIAGINGDRSSLALCTTTIQTASKALQMDNGAEASTCMSIPKVISEELIWSYLDWTATNSYPDDDSAGPSVITALLEAYPCGWMNEHN